MIADVNEQKNGEIVWLCFDRREKHIIGSLHLHPRFTLPILLLDWQIDF